MFTYPIGLLSVAQGGEPIEPPPEITSHPADQVVTSGTNGSFSVSAVGLSLTYQWQVQYGGWGSWINIDGATSSSLAVDTSNRLATNQNLYRVLVRENLGTPATSNSAKLTVNRALPGTPHAWWDATEGLYQERTGGGTTVSGDTDVVGTWRDKSGNSRHFVAVSDAARPVYDATNGWVAFDGVDDAMQQGSASDWSFLHNGGGATVFIVAKIGDVSDPNAAYTILATRNSGLTPGWLLLHDTRDAVASNRLTFSIANASGAACATVLQAEETT